jgi:hypothetical protein
MHDLTYLLFDSTTATTRYNETREMIQKTLTFSRKHTRNTTLESKEWRMETAYRILLLLRTSIAVLQLRTLGVAPWEVPELSGQELEFCRPSLSWRRHAQSTQSRESDSIKVPMLMAFLLRESVSSQEQRLSHPMTALQEDRLLQGIESYMTAYSR